MKICLKCKSICENDLLEKCPKCKGELIPYSKEKYEYYLQSQKQSTYKSKEERMYDDIHTIKNVLIIICAIFIINALVSFVMMMG